MQILESLSLHRSDNSLFALHCKDNGKQCCGETDQAEESQVVAGSPVSPTLGVGDRLILAASPYFQKPLDSLHLPGASPRDWIFAAWIDGSMPLQMDFAEEVASMKSN